MGRITDPGIMAVLEGPGGRVRVPLIQPNGKIDTDILPPEVVLLDEAGLIPSSMLPGGAALDAEVALAVADAIDAHEIDEDPHGDRQYTLDQIALIPPAEGGGDPFVADSTEPDQAESNTDSGDNTAGGDFNNEDWPLTVANMAAYPGLAGVEYGDVIQIGDEKLQCAHRVTIPEVSDIAIFDRQYGGTTMVAHANGVDIYIVNPATTTAVIGVEGLVPAPPAGASAYSAVLGRGGWTSVLAALGSAGVYLDDLDYGVRIGYGAGSEPIIGTGQHASIIAIGLDSFRGINGDNMAGNIGLGNYTLRNADNCSNVIAIGHNAGDALSGISNRLIIGSSVSSMLFGTAGSEVDILNLLDLNYGLKLTDAKDMTFGTGTGTKIGTGTDQKIGFWNKAPVIQPANGAQATLAAYGAGANGFDTGGHASALYAQVVEIARVLTLVGLWKGGA